MKIVIAPDSFKESVSAPDAAAAIARGVKAASPGAHTVCVPMADGGEGTVEAVLAATGGQERQLTVNDALGHKVDAVWGLLEDGTAVIERAAAAGLELIAPSKRDPMRASSHGVGELMLAAINAGATRIILGLGGSSTNYAGAGMMTALGVRFMDAEGHSLPPGGGSLGNGYEALHACGISAAFSLAPGPITLQQALADAEKLLADRARDVMLLWMAAQKRML